MKQSNVLFTTSLTLENWLFIADLSLDLLLILFYQDDIENSLLNG